MRQTTFARTVLLLRLLCGEIFSSFSKLVFARMANKLFSGMENATWNLLSVTEVLAEGYLTVSVADLAHDVVATSCEVGRRNHGLPEVAATKPHTASVLPLKLWENDPPSYARRRTYFNSTAGSQRVEMISAYVNHEAVSVSFLQVRKGRRVFNSGNGQLRARAVDVGFIQDLSGQGAIMESISKKTAASPKPFKFLVGRDQQEFTIHSALVAHQSPVLAALGNGKFKKSKESCVKGDDNDEVTFTSFWQFVYIRHYDSWKLLPVASTSDATTCNSDRDYMNEVLAEPEEMFLKQTHRRNCQHPHRFWGYEGFQELLEKCGGFSRALVGSMLQRLLGDKKVKGGRLLGPPSDVESEEVGQPGGFVEEGDGLDSYLTVTVASRESRTVLSLKVGRWCEMVEGDSGDSLIYFRILFEASSGTYDLNDHSIVLVRRMVDYFYTGDYGEIISDDGGADTEEDIPPLSLHTAMLALADKYDIEELRLLAIKKYAAELRSDADSSDFIRSVTDIYNLPFEVSSGLRERALDFAIHKLRDSSTTDETDDLVDKLMETCPEFTKELLRLLLRHPIMGFCRNCGTGETVPIEPLQCRSSPGVFDDEHDDFAGK
ncbi:hypothetical protein FDECE_8826 [Fusarium decemcellulare]|nr:hypothetical protein FDECE_8826 [Fusarium decemcellulare]